MKNSILIILLLIALQATASPPNDFFKKKERERCIVLPGKKIKKGSVKIYMAGQLLKPEQDYTVNHRKSLIIFNDMPFGHNQNIEIEYQPNR